MKSKDRLNLWIIGVLTIMYACTSCGGKSNKSQYDDSVAVLASSTLFEKEPIDSVSIVVAKRKENKFTGTIFGGIKFGINESTYNNAIREYNRKFDNQIYIHQGDNEVNKITIESITPSFYHKKLYKLDILIANSSAIYSLDTLFISKYGITKQFLWEFENATIELNQSINIEYNPMKEAGYATTNTNDKIYYASDARGSGAPVTRESAFTHIVYTDIVLEKLVEQETLRQDSLHQEEINRIKHSDRKKATIQVDNI